MRRLGFVLAGCLALALGVQARAAPPSLEGLWSNATSTPLERPWMFGSLVATPRQAAAWQAAVAEAFRSQADEVGGRQSEWLDGDQPMTRVRGEFRTSLIVEPASGHLPYTPQGRERALEGVYDNGVRLEGPEVRPAAERCLGGAGGAGGVPLMPANDNANYRFVQTPDSLVIAAENGGSLRIVRIGARGHAPAQVTPWGGDSIGWWEGATLVVETTNFNPGEVMKTPRPLYISTAAKVTERFSRISDGEILYEFTVDDPKTYSRPWRGEEVFRTSTGPAFEYACHEGNYALAGVLAGARHEEAEAWRPNSTPRAAGGD